VRRSRLPVEQPDQLLRGGLRPQHAHAPRDRREVAGREVGDPAQRGGDGRLAGGGERGREERAEQLEDLRRRRVAELDLEDEPAQRRLVEVVPEVRRAGDDPGERLKLLEELVHLLDLPRR
jgi:hypothetical protein